MVGPRLATATVSCIVFTNVVMGPLTAPVLRSLRLTTPKRAASGSPAGLSAAAWGAPMATRANGLGAELDGPLLDARGCTGHGMPPPRASDGGGAGNSGRAGESLGSDTAYYPLDSFRCSAAPPRGLLGAGGGAFDASSGAAPSSGGAMDDDEFATGRAMLTRSGVLESHRSLHRNWRTFDARFLKPLFGGVRHGGHDRRINAIGESESDDEG